MHAVRPAPFASPSSPSPRLSVASRDVSSGVSSTGEACPGPVYTRKGPGPCSLAPSLERQNKISDDLHIPRIRVLQEGMRNLLIDKETLGNGVPILMCFKIAIEREKGKKKRKKSTNRCGFPCLQKRASFFVGTPHRRCYGPDRYGRFPPIIRARRTLRNSHAIHLAPLSPIC